MASRGRDGQLAGPVDLGPGEQVGEVAIGRHLDAGCLLPAGRAGHRPRQSHGGVVDPDEVVGVLAAQTGDPFRRARGRRVETFHMTDRTHRRRARQDGPEPDGRVDGAPMERRPRDGGETAD